MAISEVEVDMLHVPPSTRAKPGELESARHGVVERDLESPSLTMLVLLASVGVLLYASFLLNPANAGDPLPYLMVIICESFVMFQVLLSLWTALSAAHNPRNYSYYEAKRQLFYPTSEDLHDGRLDRFVDEPAGDGQGKDDQRVWMQIQNNRTSVDVFITVYGEALPVIERTVSAARDLRGHHETFILDDGKSPAVELLAKRLGVGYLTRENNKGAKAGNINNAIRHTKSDFFVIFDADFVPSPDFLVRTIPFFAEKRVAFVQTPQVYGNISNFISKGAGYMQSVFYSLTQPGKNRFNSAFCVGTNVVFRRRAVQEIGGIYEGSKSEDIWTSLLLHEAGWKSVYIPAILAVGATPETIEAYTKQQLRWATGAFEVLFRRNPLFSRKLSVDQRLQYFGTATFYLNGLVTLVLLLLPPLQIFLNLSPIAENTPFHLWLLFYSGFYVLQIVMAVYTIGSFRWQTLLLSTVSFSIYTKALVNAFSRRDTAWHVTGRAGRANSPFNYILPQLLLFVFLLLTSLIGVWKVTWTGEISLAVFWNLINTLALGLFLGIATAEARQIHKQAPSRRRRAFRSQPNRYSRFTARYLRGLKSAASARSAIS